MSNTEEKTADPAPAAAPNNKDADAAAPPPPTPADAAVESSETPLKIEDAVAENNGKPAEAAEAAPAAEATPAAAAAAPAPKFNVHKQDFEPETVYLYQFGRVGTAPSPSAFCLKVETWLRLAGIKYQNVDHKMKFRSAKGQLPFVELNGEEIADSAVIIKELAKHFDKDFDAQLTSEQRNVAHATAAMLDNHLHWIDVWWRTKNPDAFLQGCKIDLQNMIGSKLPAALLKLVYRFSFRRKGLKKVRATGIGVHSADEIVQMGKDDLQVLIDMLGDKAFFFGQQPTTLDVVVFSHVAQLLVVDPTVVHPLRDWINENGKNLVQHFETVKQKCFPDWDEMCSTLDLNTHIPKPPPPPPAAEEEKKDAEKPQDAADDAAEKKDDAAEKKDDDKEKKETEDKTTAAAPAASTTTDAVSDDKAKESVK